MEGLGGGGWRWRWWVEVRGLEVYLLPRGLRGCLRGSESAGRPEGSFRYRRSLSRGERCDTCTW